MKLLFWLLSFAVVQIVVGVAHAADRSLVLVISERPDVRMTRAESELVAAGLETRRYLTPVAERLGPDLLRQQADETGAAAVLAVVDSGIEVWLRAKGEQGIVFVELVRHRDEDGDLSVVRAVEIVRAAVRGDERARPEVPTPIPPSKPSERAATSPRGSIFAGFGPIHSSDVGATWGVDLAGAFYLGDHVRLEANVHAAVIPAQASRATGSASVRASTLGGSIAYLPLSPRSRVRPHVSAGLSAAFLSADGSALPPFFGGSGVLVAPLVWGGAGASVRITSRMHLRADAALGTTTSSMRLAFAGGDTVAWGRPVLIVSLGVGFDFGGSADDT